MLVATGVLALLLLVAIAVAAVTRLSLARAFLVAGSALALPLTAITGNVVGGTGLEVTVGLLALAFSLVTGTRTSQRQAKSARRREARQLMRSELERRAA